MYYETEMSFENSPRPTLSPNERKYRDSLPCEHVGSKCSGPRRDKGDYKCIHRAPVRQAPRTSALSLTALFFDENHFEKPTWPR